MFNKFFKKKFLSPSIAIDVSTVQVIRIKLKPRSITYTHQNQKQFDFNMKIQVFWYVLQYLHLNRSTYNYRRFVRLWCFHLRDQVVK
jgi:hypothetical protein